MNVTMNVRERAKNYEAFMSKSSSMEREKKRYREEEIETSVSGMDDKKKMVEEGKTKPVPPPRKKKPLDKSERSPQLQHRSTFTIQIKSPPAVHPKPSKPLPSSENEKPRTFRKPPPRPAPYQNPSSPSLESKVPQPKRPSPVTRPVSAVSSSESPKMATKETPKRPPPPSKTSSLPRKPKPPLPPKPIRPVKPVMGAGKEKSATLPKALKLDNKTEDNKKNEEAKEERERSSTGPHRISLPKNKEEEKVDKMVGEDVKHKSIEEKGSLLLDTEISEENLITQTVESTKLAEGKERKEIWPVDSSLAEKLSENGKISKEVSQEDKPNRIPSDDILKDDKESETILKEDEILKSPKEKIGKDAIVILGSEESSSEICIENGDVLRNKPSERLEDAQHEEAKKPESPSLKNIENLNAAELCAEMPFVEDLIVGVEEKERTLEVSEETMLDIAEDTTEVIANEHFESDDIENSQSISNADSKNLNQSAELQEENIPKDMTLEDSNEKSIEISSEIKMHSPYLVENSNMNYAYEDEEINSVEKCLERLEEQEIFKSAADDEGKSLVNEDTAISKRKSGEQDEPAINTVVEEQKDIEQTEEPQQPKEDDIFEPTPEEPEHPVDEEKQDQEDLATEVKILEEKKEAALDLGKDTMKNNEQGENVVVKTGKTTEVEELEEALEGATQQQESQLEDFNEASLDQPSSMTIEDDLFLQEEVTETVAEEKLSEQTDATQSSRKEVEEVTTDPNQLGELSSELDVPMDKDSDTLNITIENSGNKDTEMGIEDKAEMVLNGDESVPQTMESISLKTKEDDQEDNTFSLDEPIRPRRPSRLKKLAKNNIKETETLSASKPLVQPQIEESCQEEEPQSKAIAPYENVILDVSKTEVLPESLQDSVQSISEKPSPRYENVILPSERESKESGNPSIYEVPRRSSFHAERSQEKNMVRKARSSSIGSLERKSESEYQVPKARSRTVAAEQTYVMPRPTRVSTESSENDETYVVPKSIRTTSPTQVFPVFESEYHVPQSLVSNREESREAEYQVPPRVRTMAGSEEEEGMYSVPTSPPTIPRGSGVESTSGSEEEEGMYSVPTSTVSVLGEMQVEGEQMRQSSECDDDALYSVPSATLAKYSEPSSNETLPEELRRSSRSSVLTSRSQLPKSFKHAPPKPPRRSISGDSKDEDQETMTTQEDEGYQPVTVPTPRSTVPTTKQSPEVTPRTIPQPTPQHKQADGSKKGEELPAPSPPKDQSKLSPKPKRPAPPRPKAPDLSPLPKKEVEDTVTPEVKNHSAPPRPPPPSVNRISIAPSEAESVSSATGLQSQSSESESEDEKGPEPTGPPKKKTYFIAHEILSTEKTFVNALTLCYEDCYGLIKSADVVPESVLNDIFKDLGNIYQLDMKFLQELEERMKTWDEHERIGDIVKKYGHFLKMYTTYINNYDKAMNVLQETTKENLQFAELVNQFQASEKCNGLFLISFMLKPVQRIPSYRLLLKDYLKHLPPDSEEFKDIQVALGIVSEVATHINESMKKADNFERVLRIQESLVGNAEIVKPGRDLIKEGVLNKLCRKDMQERMFFLLTDVLLYTAPVGSTQYKLKEKLPLLGMKVTLPESPDFENEFSIISKMRSFTLSASTSAKRDEWIEELRNAINALADKKKTFLKPKDGSPVVETEVEEESKIGEKAPVWIPDARVTMCMLCTDNFTVTNRRHHCRGCGKVVCGSCSDNLAPLAYLDYVQARVCEVCYDFLLKEQNKSESNNDFERLPASPLGMTNEDLDRIHRKPPKFEILHRFKPGNKSHAKRKSKAFGRPSVCTEVVGHDSGSQMSGYLKFKRTNRHGWKRLWFVLKDNVLYTYKASEDVVAIETIPILGYVVQEATRTEDEIQFQLKHAGLPPITFKTESESSVSRWIQELKKATTL